MSLSDNYQADVSLAFNSTSRYQYALLNIDKLSEYDPGIPYSQTAEQPAISQGELQDIYNNKTSKRQYKQRNQQLFLVNIIAKLRRT